MTVSVLMSASLVMVVKGGLCPADPTVDLCDITTTGNSTNATNGSGSGDESSGALRRAGAASGTIMAAALACGLGSKGGPSSQILAPLVLSALMVPGQAASAGGAESERSLAASSLHQTCSDMKSLYKSEGCCGSPTKTVHMQSVPFPPKTGNKISGTNICAGKKPGGKAWENFKCMKDGVVMAVEQAGADVTRGFEGKLVTKINPAMKPYRLMSPPLCPVNVHWHLGAEHRSAGQYDENGKSPKKAHPDGPASGRRLNASERSLAAKVRYGFACKHYDANNAIFTKAYDWKHCEGMHVGETYEVHWPHSAIGACGTPHQYQSPFYDGVFCNYEPNGAHKEGLTAQQIAVHIGVQAQVFVIVNDESYYYPDLMKGMIQQGNFGKDLGIYSGSTTGTSRDNKVCSKFAPITWQVDRTCHKISASSFDKMCADMKQNPDDMSSDLHAHGARELVDAKLSANNLKKYDAIQAR